MIPFARLDPEARPLYRPDMTRQEYRTRLASGRVGIAGAGGLGSNCAMALARAGLGTLVIADFDTVSEANLDRQAFFRDQIGMPKVAALAANIGRIDPGIRVITHGLRLDADSIVALFGECDAIVEAFDVADAKAMLLETVSSRLPDMPFVCASGIAGFGAFERIHIHRSGMMRIVGDLESEVTESIPAMAPRVIAIASIQADLILEFLLNRLPE